MTPVVCLSKRRFLFIVIILLIGSIALSACGSGNSLYGTWVEPNSGVQLVIKNNGEILTTVNGTTITMKYTLEDPDVLIIAGSKDESVPDQKITYAATQDKLTFTVDGVPTVFDRVK